MVVFLVAAVPSLISSYRRSRAADWARTRFDPAAYGLVPAGLLDSRRPGPPGPPGQRERSQAIADAAWGGDWRPAAAHVGAAGRDWDERWSRLELLAEIAKQDDAWLTQWRITEPDNCDAATLTAQLAVDRAWAIRGTGYAHQVPAQNREKFRQLLPAAIEAARRASLLDPENPGPWVVMVTAARGAQYTHRQFRPLWDGLVARAPHHYTGHRQGLQYRCAKWAGSSPRMMLFARRTLLRAPAGSPLAGIYLHALSELAERTGHIPFHTAWPFRRHLRAVTASLAALPEDSPHLHVLRHLLAHHLNRAGLFTEALEQFRLIGRWCGTSPWRDQGTPMATFDLARGIAVRLSRTEPLPAQTHRAQAAHM